jgi:hypothetical protein
MFSSGSCSWDEPIKQNIKDLVKELKGINQLVKELKGVHQLESRPKAFSSVFSVD